MRPSTPPMATPPTSPMDGPDTATSAGPSKEQPRSSLDWRYGFVLGFVLFGIMNQMPFADAKKYQVAIQECEKNLPRYLSCEVQGVVVPVPPPSKAASTAPAK